MLRTNSKIGNYKVPEIGTVVYFLKPVKVGNYRYGLYDIGFGIVDDILGSEVCIQLITKNKKIKINGTPIEKNNFPTDWKKLPAGWKLSDNLIDVQETPLPDVDITNPDAILDAYIDGTYINTGDALSGNIGVQIDPINGYRIIFEKEYRANTTVLSVAEIYDKYEDAAKEKGNYMNLFELQAGSSEIEFSLQKIKSVVEEYINNKFRYDDARQRNIEGYMNYFSGFKSVENLEVRSKTFALEWKYKDRVKWNIVEPDEVEEW